MTKEDDELKAASISQFIKAIRRLPSDAPQATPGKWYKTQKEHWLGWLGEYHGPGAYGRISSKERDAQFAYNHIVEPKMLSWLIEASGVPAACSKSMVRILSRKCSMSEKSAAIRRLVPWPELAERLFDRRVAVSTKKK